MNYLREFGYCFGLIKPERIVDKTCYCRDRDKLIDFCNKNHVLIRGKCLFSSGTKKALYCQDYYEDLVKISIVEVGNKHIDRFVNIISPKLYVCDKDNVIVGDCVFQTYEGNYKVIDFENKKTYYFADQQYIEEVCNNIEQFKDDLRFPIEQGTLRGGSVLVEKYINNCQLSPNDKYYNLLCDLKEYYSHTDVLDWDNYHKDLEFLATFHDRETVLFYQRCLKTDVFADDLPIVFSHCDLHSGNIIWDGNNQWYIDHGLMADANIFQDIFRFPRSGNGNLDILSDKKVRKVLREIFDIFSLPFDEKLLKKYLYRFVVTRVVMFLRKGKNSIKEYCDFLDKVDRI